MAIIKKIVVSIKALWEKVRNKFDTKKKAAIGVIAILVLLIAFLQGIDWLREKFTEGEVVFKTTDIFPNVDDRTYDLCIIPGGEVIPIVNPMPQGDNPREAAGPRNNITFTITNNNEKELLIDKIEAVLIDYEKLPEKHIVTRGPFAVVRPIDLYLNLNPNQKEYELSRGMYISIESGRTEHVFKVWVSGKEPGIYRFKINLQGRLGGERQKVIESDMLYSFVVPEETSPTCLYLYRGEKADPNFTEVLQIVEKPIVEFRETVSSWDEYKLMDSLHNAHMGLKYFIWSNLNIAGKEIGEEAIGAFKMEASEILLNEKDLSAVWDSFSGSDGSPIETLWRSGNLPGWLREEYEVERDKKAVSAKTIKYVSKNAPGVTVIYNTVAIYPTTELAKEAYLNTLSNDCEPFSYEGMEIGDEYYFTRGTSVGFHMDVVVFRKGNVVSVVAGEYSTFFIDKYAKIIEQKISN